MKTWANGGDGVSALALLAEVSGAVPVAFTVATIKKKLSVFSDFCNASTGSPNIYIQIRISIQISSLAFEDRWDTTGAISVSQLEAVMGVSGWDFAFKA